jgi:Protein of unknown function (DUF2281)
MIAENSILLDIPENVVASLRILSSDRRQQVFDFVEFLSQKQENIASEQKIERIELENPVQKRVLGLHSGKGWVSDDFEEPLADGFWGEEDLI